MTGPRARTWIALLGMLAAAAGLGVSGVRHHTASRHAASARADLDHTAALARRVVELRSVETASLPPDRPEGDALPLIRRALADASIPADRLREVAPAGDAPIRGAGSASDLRRRSVRVTLDRCQPADLGQFLAAWRARQPRWRIRSIGLVPASASDTSFTAQLTVTFDYRVAQSSESP